MHICVNLQHTGRIHVCLHLLTLYAFTLSLKFASFSVAKWTAEPFVFIRPKQPMYQLYISSLLTSGLACGSVSVSLCSFQPLTGLTIHQKLDFYAVISPKSWLFSHQIHRAPPQFASTCVFPLTMYRVTHHIFCLLVKISYNNLVTSSCCSPRHKVMSHVLSAFSSPQCPPLLSPESYIVYDKPINRPVAILWTKSLSTIRLLLFF